MPGHVSEFDSHQGSVRKLINSRGSVGKDLVSGNCLLPTFVRDWTITRLRY